jgi:MarR family transcriptional regulator, temperature-dependent positive regulator of motility
MELEKSRAAFGVGDELRTAMNGADNPAGVAWRINYLANFYTGPLYKELDERWGLSRPQFVVMYCLRQIGGLLARDIAFLSGRPKNSISRAVNLNLTLGLIAYDGTSPDGGRPLRLTGEGEALLNEVLPLFRARESSMLSVLTASERQLFDSLLRKLSIRTDDWAKAY